MTDSVWKKFPGPSLERVMLAGWQDRSGTTQGYWWKHEGFTDENGMPFEDERAIYWTELPSTPDFPPPPGAKL